MRAEITGFGSYIFFGRKQTNIVHLWEAIEQNAITCHNPKNKDMMGRYLLNTNSHHSRHTHLLYTKPVLDRVGEVNVCMGPHHVCFDGEEYLLAYAKNVSPISHTEFLIFYKLDKHTTHTKLDNTILVR